MAELFSASEWNDWMARLLECYDRATLGVFPFGLTREVIGEQNSGDWVTVWSGYILYTGDTDIFRYKFSHDVNDINKYAETKLTINGVVVFTKTDLDSASYDTTIDLSGQGYTANTVYSVLMESHHAAGATVDLDVVLDWLGWTHTEAWVDPTTFTDTTVPAAAAFTSIQTMITRSPRYRR
jgi:hypothetical protein